MSVMDCNGYSTLIISQLVMITMHYIKLFSKLRKHTGISQFSFFSDFECGVY